MLTVIPFKIQHSILKKMSPILIGYGELLLRLTPIEHGNLLEQSDRLQMAFAGAEANILIDLSLLGHPTSFMSAFPKNPVGRAAHQFLQKFGVHTQHLIWDEGRVGAYYIEHGTSIRGTRVTYDRANSSICLAKIETEIWKQVFENASYFILTGITPALSAICQDNIKVALEVAQSKGVKVVFDLNYRRTLWDAKAARHSFESILPFVDILIANTGAAYDVFDIKTSPIQDYESLQKASQQATDQLSVLGDFEWIGMTLRLQKSANKNILGGMIKKEDYFFSTPLPTQIVDRLGGGDAFSAAMLHGIIHQWSTTKIVQFATAAFAATQTLHGDINYLTEEELQSIADGNIRGFVKR